MGGRPSGFDYLRLGLSLSVIFFHSIEFSDKSLQLGFLQKAPFNVWNLSVVPMFFALSGFLVSGSLDRTRSVIGFLGLRTLRIFPALAVDTLFSAVVLGLSFTTLPWTTYLSTPAFRSYLLNMLGDIHYFLPGVFLGNPTPFVNVQLWTIPFELLCYLSLVILTTTGIYRRWPALFLGAALLTIWIGAPSEGETGHLAGHLLVSSFLLGAAVHLYRHVVPWSARLCGLGFAAMILFVSVPHLLRYLPIPVVYVTVFLGTLDPKRLWPLRGGDYSYGLYLYGFPVTQTLIATLKLAHVWYFCFAFTVLLTGVFAALSWHAIEKQCLAFKPQLLRLESRLLAGIRLDIPAALKPHISSFRR